MSNFSQLACPENPKVPEVVIRRANCQQTSPSVMDGETFEDILQARKVCSSCSVIKECLAWAVWFEPCGVWGGLTPGERKPLRNGEALIDLQEMARIAEFRDNLFSGKTVFALALEYGVEERTIYRWRAEVRRADTAVSA